MAATIATTRNFPVKFHYQKDDDDDDDVDDDDDDGDGNDLYPLLVPSI